MIKVTCDLCGKEMESYIDRGGISTPFGMEYSCDRKVHPWEHAGKHIVCPSCKSKIDSTYRKVEEVKCVACPMGLILSHNCNVCEHNWGFAGTISGVRCNYEG